MELSRTQKILLGLATAWPPVYIFLFMIAIFAFIGFAGPGNGEPPAFFPIGFIIFFAVHILSIFLGLALTVFYVIHAVKNPKVEGNMRIIWILLFFFAGIIAEPAYWYLEVWRKEAPTPFDGLLREPLPTSWASSQNAESPEYVPPNEPPDWR